MSDSEYGDLRIQGIPWYKLTPVEILQDAPQELDLESRWVPSKDLSLGGYILDWASEIQRQKQLLMLLWGAASAVYVTVQEAAKRFPPASSPWYRNAFLEDSTEMLPDFQVLLLSTVGGECAPGLGCGFVYPTGKDSGPEIYIDRSETLDDYMLTAESALASLTQVSRQSEEPDLLLGVENYRKSAFQVASTISGVLDFYQKFMGFVEGYRDLLIERRVVSNEAKSDALFGEVIERAVAGLKCAISAIIPQGVDLGVLSVGCEDYESQESVYSTLFEWARQEIKFQSQIAAYEITDWIDWQKESAKEDLRDMLDELALSAQVKFVEAVKDPRVVNAILSLQDKLMERSTEQIKEVAGELTDQASSTIASQARYSASEGARGTVIPLLVGAGVIAFILMKNKR